MATALRRLADLLETSGAGNPPRQTRHRATTAVLHAYHCLGVAPLVDAGKAGPGREAAFRRLTDLSWTLLVRSARHGAGDSVATAGLLRRQARLLTDRRRRVPIVLDELCPHPAAPAARSGAEGERAVPPPGAAAPDGPAARRATDLLRGLHGAAPFAVLAVPALRMALGTGVAAGVAALLHPERGYWAAISAAAVLHSVNLRITSQRAAQRALGTAAGLLLAFVALAADVEPVVLAVLIVVMEFLLEYAVVRNYALAVVFVTPLAPCC
ncbi:FUSC family protein [Streptomyces flaveolus]|uniref:FUSC family protein n=1 Tax=Streptomyces flaveolus TaxID=67297 RepID=UPI00331AC378